MAKGLITIADFPMANPAASLAQGLAQGMQLGLQRRQLDQQMSLGMASAAQEAYEKRQQRGLERERLLSNERIAGAQAEIARIVANTGVARQKADESIQKAKLDEETRQFNAKLSQESRLVKEQRAHETETQLRKIEADAGMVLQNLNAELVKLEASKRNALELGNNESANRINEQMVQINADVLAAQRRMDHEIKLASDKEVSANSRLDKELALRASMHADDTALRNKGFKLDYLEYVAGNEVENRRLALMARGQNLQNEQYNRTFAENARQFDVERAYLRDVLDDRTYIATEELGLKREELDLVKSNNRKVELFQKLISSGRTDEAKNLSWDLYDQYTKYKINMGRLEKQELEQEAALQTLEGRIAFAAIRAENAAPGEGAKYVINKNLDSLPENSSLRKMLGLEGKDLFFALNAEVSESALMKDVAEVVHKEKQQVSDLKNAEADYNKTIADTDRVLQEIANKKEDRETAKQRNRTKVIRDSATILAKTDSALSQVGFWNTGLIGSITSAFGVPNTVDLESAIETIQSLEFVDALTELKQLSPTGSGVGQATEKEGDKLQARIASLKIGMSEEALTQGLKDIRFHYARIKELATGYYKDEDFINLVDGGPIDLGSNNPVYLKQDIAKIVSGKGLRPTDENIKAYIKQASSYAKSKGFTTEDVIDDMLYQLNTRGD